MKDNQTDTTKEFWDRLAKVTAGMLQTGPTHSMPMSHYADPDEGLLWFITSKGTQAHQAAVENRATQFLVADPSSHIYAHITGALQEVHQPGKLDELWTRAAAAWFEDGRDDPDVRLLCLRPEQAEVWLTDGGAKFLYEIACASKSERTPDVGEHAVIRL